MSDYEKLEFIHFAIQEAMQSLKDNPELKKALGYVEDLREPHLNENNNDDDGDLDYTLRFDEIMAEVDKWAEDNAVWDCREEAVADVMLMLEDEEYKGWSNDKIVESAIQAWKMAE